MFSHRDVQPDEYDLGELIAQLFREYYLDYRRTHIRNRLYPK